MNDTQQTPAQQVARRPTNFEIEMSNYEPQIQAALPNHIPLERFKRVVITAVNQNPALTTADRRSLFLSCVRAAQDGLFPDGREAALVIFNKQVQYLPMIAGIIKRMRNSGDVAAVDSQIVHENDKFDYALGDDPHILHKPTLGDPGKPTAAYAIIKLTNGEVLREVMSVAQIEKVRAVSRAKDNGPWVSWWDEMARKTVLRRCSKRAPVSSDLDDMLRRDDEDRLDQAGATGVIETPVERPKPPGATASATVIEQASEVRLAEFHVTTIDGEIVTYTEPLAAAEAMSAQTAQAAALGEPQLEGLWETNAPFMSDLRGALPAAADKIITQYGALMDDFITKRRAAAEAAAKKPAPVKPEAKKAETAKPAPQAEERSLDEPTPHPGPAAADSAAVAPKPAATPPQETRRSAQPKPMKSPLASRKADEWPAWVKWFLEAIVYCPKADIQALWDRYEAEIAFCEENRKADHAEIVEFFEKRRVPV